MALVELQGIQYQINDKESLLDGLLRHEVTVPHGCKAGACQSCMMQTDPSAVPAAAQAGLKETQKKLGYFLSCLCHPQQDLNVDFVDRSGMKASARVLDIKSLNDQIVRLRLQPVIDYNAGQYLNIWLDENTIRSYSIASVAEQETFIELHVKQLPDGRFSSGMLNNLIVGESLTIQGPLGECFYSTADRQQTLLLAGIGTGLAPLYGIVKDALRQGHAGDIHLWAGAREANQLYLTEELMELQNTHANLSIYFVAQQANTAANVIEGDIYQTIKEHHPSTKSYQVFLCGAESFVRKLKKQCFLAGANMNDIHSDVFLPCS